MTNFFEKLTIAVATGGNCVNLGRSLASTDPDLYQWIIETSCFLNSKNPKFTERVWNVLNNNNEIMLDAFGKPARFVNLFKGYSLKNHTYTKCANKSKKLSEKAEKPSVQKKTKTKIEIFLERNSYRNASLYIATAVEGIDYVCCPMSGARLRFIRKDYIEKVLGINLESYKKQFPNQQMVCSGRVDTIKAGLQQVDSISGVSKHALSIQKSRVSKNKINPLTGITPNQQIGKSARKTHMSNVDEYGRNGYSQIATTAIIKGNKTKVEKGLILPPENQNEYKRFKIIVTFLTTKIKPALLEGSRIRLGLAGTPGAYHIDHMFSVNQAFKEGISPLLVGHVKNLRLIPWEENTSKNYRSSLTREQLFALCDYTEDMNQKEFDDIMKIIKYDMEHNIPATGAYVLERYYATLPR